MMQLYLPWFDYYYYYYYYYYYPARFRGNNEVERPPQWNADGNLCLW